jgi:hypothetical protein
VLAGDLHGLLDIAGAQGCHELDVGKLIDFPVMTDVREPLTVAFLRAKREADGLRPAKPEEMADGGEIGGEDRRRARFATRRGVSS